MLESDRMLRIFCKKSSLVLMAMELPLSDFCIIKLSFFNSDFNDANSSLVKFKGALFLFQSFLTFPSFHTEVSHLKEILRKNAFLIKLIGNCIKKFLNKTFLHTPVALNVEKKKQLFIVLQYLGILSFTLRTRLQNSINKDLPYCKIKLIFKSTTCLSNFFLF